MSADSTPTPLRQRSNARRHERRDARLIELFDDYLSRIKRASDDREKLGLVAEMTGAYAYRREMLGHGDAEAFLDQLRRLAEADPYDDWADHD